MPSSQHYQVLPLEEKLEDEQPRNPPHTPKWRKTRLAVAFSFFFLLSFTLVAVTARALTRHPPASETSIQDEEEAAESWVKDHLTRASGDTYLIGVGKADITGYVKKDSLFLCSYTAD
jgi:neutral ceramidase